MKFPFNKKAVFFLIVLVVSLLSNIGYGESNQKLISIIKAVDALFYEDNAKYSALMEINRDEHSSTYKLTVWNKNKTYVSRVEEPLVDKGTIYLQNERGSWIYYPSIEKTVKTSGNQRILGSDLSINDISNINISEDYDYRFIELDDIQLSNLVFDFVGELDIEELKNGYIIECNAKAGKIVHYKKVILYVSNAMLPLREEFYTLSGKLLGVMNFMDIGDLNGKIKPKKFIMRTTLRKENYTVFSYTDADYDVEIPVVYLSEQFINKLSKMN